MKRKMLVVMAGFFVAFAALAQEPFDFEKWSDHVDQLAQAAREGQAQAYHDLFLLTLHTDGGMFDYLGERLEQVKAANPKRFNALLKKERKKVREWVELHLAYAREEMPD